MIRTRYGPWTAAALAGRCRLWQLGVAAAGGIVSRAPVRLAID